MCMCNMCVMMTEMWTIEGGQKRCHLTRGDQIYLKKMLQLYCIFSHNKQVMLSM